MGDFLYFIGGEASGGLRNRPCWKLDLSNPVAWVPIADIPDSGTGNGGGISNTEAAALGTDIYVVGGYSGPAAAPVLLTRVLKYDTLTDTWTEITTDPYPVTTGIYANTLTALGGKIYSIGGSHTTTTFTSAARVYDPSALTGSRWSDLPLMPAARRFGTARVIDGKLHVGANIGAALFGLNDVAVYDPATNLWTTLLATAVEHGGGAIFDLNGEPYVVAGGWGGTGIPPIGASGEVYSGGAWMAGDSLGVARRTIGNDQSEDYLAVVGGWVGTYSASAEVYELSGGGCGCVCNYDTSTGADVCDFFDFITFQDLFAASDPCGCELDTSTGPGVCDFFDFIIFQDLFSAGC